MRLADRPGAARLQATDLSADGAFLRSATPITPNARLRLRLELPTDPRPIELTARVVRTNPLGVGVRFEEVSARDRARLRNHAGFYEMDQAIVRVQRALGDLMPGNLLPLGEPSEIATILETAIERQPAVSLIVPGKGFKPRSCSLAELGPPPADATASRVLRLDDLTAPVGNGVRTLYLAFSDPPLHYALEAIVLSGGERPTVAVPERLYLTERRTAGRSSAPDARCEFAVTHTANGVVEMPILDLGRGGASVRLAAPATLVPGMRLPGFTLVEGDLRRAIGGATVRYVARLGDEALRVGLSFDAGVSDRDAFGERKRQRKGSGLRQRLTRAVSYLSGKVASMVRPAERVTSEEVEVVRYRNRRGDFVAAIVDANFDTAGGSIRPDVAVVIAPAILKRKEVFGLLARTILDDLDRDGLKVVTLRFDATHIVGESTMDEKLAAENRPYYNWTFSHLADDIEASLAYVERRFRPAKRVLASVSLSAIPARKVMLSSRAPRVDLWVAPYGCPDARDVLRNYLAGLDLFEVYERGEGPETVLIHGRPIDGRQLYGEALASGMASLDDARHDMSRIEAPVVWILGTYDCWVTRSRVRSLLDAPGGGEREIFEAATGHVLKTGEEAIELFKLVSESISKHLFAADRPAREPNLARFAQQSEAEWGRVQRLRLDDSEMFWKEHLLGDEGDEVGYDVLLDHPEYPAFLARQVELLDPRPGDHLADFGCGTGNLALAMLDAYSGDERPGSLTFLDLVPEAIERTEEKLRARFPGGGPPLKGVVADLEMSRLVPIYEFVVGRLYGIEEMAERVEGLPASTARKLSLHYGKELHAVLRGLPASAERIRELCPKLDEREVEIVREIGRAARFVRDRVEPGDLREGARGAHSTGDLEFEHLVFGESSRKVTLDLPGASFDRIGSSLVISYLFDPFATLREMRRLLKPGGVLVASSIRANFDPSKLYAEGVEILQGRLAAGDDHAQRKIEALRHFGNMVSRLVELEEDGRFRFFTGEELKALVLAAGFARAHVFEGFGSPATAVIVRAER